MIKYGGDAIEREITALFQKIIRSGKMPNEWRTSITTPIFKKGERKDPKNYRGISLLCSIAKLPTKIISRKITREIGISEEQQGFRQNRSTIDAIFISRQLIEKSIEFNKPLFLCFVDLTQAFDRVRLRDVLEILHQKSMDERIIKVIRELNRNNRTHIKVRNTLTEEVPVTSGIRQGDSLSPTLFNVVMDKIVEGVKEVNAGYQMGNGTIKILCYADDAVLLAESEDDLQRLLYKFEITAETYNMQISHKKTQSMVISKDPIRCKLAVNNLPIQQVMNFNYLGVNLSSDRNTNQEVRLQTTKAIKISGCLKDIIWKNKLMSMESKTRIYKTCIRPILTYAAETRADTAKTKSMLRSAEMRVIRTVKGVTLMDKIPSRTLRDECNVQDVVRWMRKRRRGWRDHVDRMGPQRLARFAKTEKPETSRLPGRPSKRWAESWTSASQEAQSPDQTRNTGQCPKV